MSDKELAYSLDTAALAEQILIKDGKLSPLAQTTRAEAVVFLYRIYNQQ